MTWDFYYKVKDGKLHTGYFIDGRGGKGYVVPLHKPKEEGK